MMKLKKINITGLLAMLVFEDGEDGDRAIFNHVCDGSSCLADSFDTSIKYLLNAHGVNDIQITDYTGDKPVEERGCNDCHYCEWAANQGMDGSFIVMRCNKDNEVSPIEVDVSDLTGDLGQIQGKLFDESKSRATACHTFKKTTTGLNKWIADRR